MKKVISLILLLLGVGFLVIWFNHQFRLTKESKLLSPLGQTVMVNQKEMTIHSQGQGAQTLVFLSGAGTISPILDSQALANHLTDDYRFVVVEKFGYGFSQDSDAPRGNATVLEEVRRGLQEAGVEGPYVLVAHSMSGLLALYWVQHYPEEVTAILGLDMASPESYHDVTINLPLMYVASFWEIVVLRVSFQP